MSSRRAEKAAAESAGAGAGVGRPNDVPMQQLIGETPLGDYDDAGHAVVLQVGDHGLLTLPNTPLSLPIEKGIITRVEGSLETHPFKKPKRGVVSYLAAGAFKLTGFGYLYYRIACTRMLPGYIMYVQDGSDQFVLSRPGMYWFPGPTRHVRAPQRLGTQECLTVGNAKIVTIPPSNLGFCSINSQVHLLQGGSQYVLDSPLITYIGSHHLDQPIINVEQVTVFRVQAGEFACVRDSQGHIIVLNRVGRYVLRSPEVLLAINTVTVPRVEFGTFQRVRLQAGQLIFYCDVDGHTQFHDQPGTYELRRPAFFDESIRDVTEPIIQFGSITRVLLKRGQISFKYDASGNTILLEEQGVHLIQRPEQFGGQLFDVKQEQLKLGAFTVVNVQPGHVALTYDGRMEDPKAAGKSKIILGSVDHAQAYSALKILTAGRHTLNHELWSLREVRSIQERRLDLSTKVYSKNRVSFIVKAFILYKVEDPLRAFVTVQNVDDELQREAEATILSIFGAHDSAEVAQGLTTSNMVTAQTPNVPAMTSAAPSNATTSAAAAGSSGLSDPPTYSEASFADVVRTSFQHDFSGFAEMRGVALTRMRVEHIDFDDKDMKVAIEKQAENTVRIEAERRNVNQQNQTLIAKAEGEAKARRVEAEGRAAATRAETDAEANRIRSVAAAQSEASSNPLATQMSLIKAYAEGQAMIYAALSKNAAVIPSDITLSVNALPQQVAELLNNSPGSQFSVGPRAGAAVRPAK